MPSPRVRHRCCVCQRLHWTTQSEINKGKGKYCSVRCAAKERTWVLHANRAPLPPTCSWWAQGGSRQAWYAQAKQEFTTRMAGRGKRDVVQAMTEYAE